MSTTGASPFQPLGTHRSSSAQAQSTTPPLPQGTTPSQSRSLRSARDTSSGTTNWFVQVQSAEPRASRGRADGVTSMQTHTVTAESPREAKVDDPLRQRAQAEIAAADKCLDDVIEALSTDDFKAVPQACEAVTDAFATVVNGMVKKAETVLTMEGRALRTVDAEIRKAQEALSKDEPQSSRADVANKVAKADPELASLREELLAAEKMRLRRSGFVADACGARLRHLLPQLEDGQLRLLNRRLNAFLKDVKAEQKGVHQAADSNHAVLAQLLFSVKAELLRRVVRDNKDSSDEKKIRDYSKEELVTLRKLTTSLERMVRPETPDNAVLPGARLTLAGVRGVDQHAESLLQQILRRESAEKRVKTAQTILKGSDLPRLGRLKASVDFLVTEGVTMAGVSLLQLQTDVSARIKVVEQNKYDELITNARPFGTSQKFTDPIAWPDAQLLALQKTLREQDVLTPELARAKTGVEDAIKERKADVAAKFRKAFRPLLTEPKPSQVTNLLLKSAAVASESLTAYEKLNWDFLEEGIADWIGDEVRGTRVSGERVGVDPLYAKGMESLLVSLSSGEGRLVRNLLAANQDDGSKAAVAYLDALHHTLDMLLWDDKKSPRAMSGSLNVADLTAESLQALQTTLNLTVKNGQLVQYKAVANPATSGAPQPQKN